MRCGGDQASHVAVHAWNNMTGIYLAGLLILGCWKTLFSANGVFTWQVSCYFGRARNADISDSCYDAIIKEGNGKCLSTRATIPSILRICIVLYLHRWTFVLQSSSSCNNILMAIYICVCCSLITKITFSNQLIPTRCLNKIYSFQHSSKEYIQYLSHTLLII